MQVDRWVLDWDKENGVESWLTKGYKEIDVDRREVETNTGGYKKNRQR